MTGDGCVAEEAVRPGGVWTRRVFGTHHADLRSHQVAEPVEPLHIRLQVGGPLVITEAALQQQHNTLLISVRAK